MTVKKLIKLLQEQDPHAKIFVSDSEGNYYNPLGVVDGGMRVKNGEAGLDRLTPWDIKQGYTEEDVMKGGQLAVILYQGR